MRVAVVSICAYPLEHPLVLRNITPDNRKSYGNLHGYDVHVHYDHPMPGEGVHIQHSKLQLVADYLRSGLYDWVAWFDCDSIITNLNRTLDSVIFRYARRDARFMPLEHGKTSGLNSGDYDTFGGHGDGPEPLEDEVLESFVGHVGSCNSDEGCFLSTTLRVNPRTRYVATLRAAQIDMAEDSEKLSFVTVGGQDMGALALAGFDQWPVDLHRNGMRQISAMMNSQGLSLKCHWNGIQSALNDPLHSFTSTNLLKTPPLPPRSQGSWGPNSIQFASGECNPKPDNDFDCRLHNCFTDVEVPAEAVATGRVTMEARASWLKLWLHIMKQIMFLTLRCHRIGHGYQEGPWNLLLLSMSEAVRTHNATWLIQHWDSWLATWSCRDRRIALQHQQTTCMWIMWMCLLSVFTD